MNPTPKSYYTPDTIWSFFGISNQNEYFGRYVIEGRFHSSVHNDILKSYETVKYLMAHSYYHWPMFDEAKKRLLGIFEMAVKLRSKEVRNSLTIDDKSGKSRKKSLSQLINDLETFGYTPEVIKRLHWIRKLRNMHAHPDSHSFAGATNLVVVHSILNGINSLFLTAEELINTNKQLVDQQAAFSEFLNGLYVVHHKEQKILAYDAALLRCWKKNNSWVTGVFFHPVLNKTSQHVENHKIPSPIVFYLSEINFTSKGIKAIDSVTGQKVSFLKTTKAEHNLLYESHLLEWRQISAKQKVSYEFACQNQLHIALEKEIYQSW